MKDVYPLVKKEIPKFNDYVIKGFRRSQMELIIKAVHNMWFDILKILNNPNIQYKGYRILTPEERVKFEFSKSVYKNSAEIAVSELILICYLFTLENEQHEVYLYLPYDYESFIVLLDSRYFLLYVVMEKLFFKIKDGINIKTKLPIHFKGYKTYYMFQDINGNKYFDTIINVEIHNKKSASSKKAAIMHYLLSNYGFYKTIEIFGFNKEQIDIVNKVDKDDNYLYFPLFRNLTSNTPLLKVDKKVFKTYLGKRIVSSIIYVVLGTKFTIDEFLDPKGSLFKIILGRLIYGKNINKILVSSHIESHLGTLDSYIDTITKNKLKEINVSTIWDLLIYTFINFEKLFMSIENNNLFTRKLNLTETVIELLIEDIYKAVYNFINRNKNQKLIHYRKLLSISYRKIRDLYKISNKKFISTMYNDNLLVHLLRSLDQIELPDPKSKLRSNLYLFHPSFALLKNLNYFSSNKPEKNALINPYIKLDEDGNIHPPDDPELLEELKELEKHI